LFRLTPFPGVLRNSVDPGSPADELVDIVALANGTILQLVNGLLDVDLPSISSEVMHLVSQAVSPV